MNKLQLWGLLFQIPNAAIVLFFILYFLSGLNWSFLSMKLIFFVIIGVLYGLMNIASIILLITGAFKNE